MVRNVYQQLLVFILFVLSPAWAVRCIAPADLQHTITTRPTADAYSALGFWFAERSQFSCAVDAFKTAVRKNGAPFETCFNLGGAVVESGDYKGASEHLHAATQLRPNDTDRNNVSAHVNLGLSLTAQKRFAESAQVLQKALNLQPGNTATLKAAGMNKARMGDLAGAAEAFRTIVKLEPQSAEAHLNLGVVLADRSGAEDGPPM